MGRVGSAGAVGLPRGGGEGERRVSESGSCFGVPPPSPLGESVYSPPPRFRHLIGCWDPGNSPLLLARVPKEPNHCAGWRGWRRGGRWYDPPRGPAPQCLALRPCATWQEARAGGGGGLLGRGFWVVVTAAPPQAPAAWKARQARSAPGSVGVGKEAGSVSLVCGWEARVLWKSARGPILKEPQ